MAEERTASQLAETTGAGGKEQEADRTVKNVCPCNENHWLARYNKFRKMSLEQRMEFVKNKGLSLNCFTTGHFVRSCLKKSFCKIQGCTGKHSMFSASQV